MGRKSIKENKSHYQVCREACEYTRAEASDLMTTISEDRLEKIENEKTRVHPEDVVELAEAYKQPEMCNWFCHEECAIGRRIVPELETMDLTQAVMDIMNRINGLNDKKDRMVALAADGQISESERKEFGEIYEQLDELTNTVEALKVWVRKTLADGKLVDKPFE